jgi:RNA polymerase sigma-70 factor (ECF subfamily)
MTKNDDFASDRFIQLLMTHQSNLRGYILGSLGNYAYSEDVLQQTNLVLWKKCSEFRQGADFLPWAFAIARYEILAFIRDKQREQLVFCPDVSELMMESCRSMPQQVNERQEALRECIKRLPERQLEVLKLSYVANAPMLEISQLMGRSVDGVKSLLVRIRKTLRCCIENNLGSQEGGLLHAR